MTWYLAVKLPILCALAGILELDDAHVGQWMLSRPFITGPLIGAAIGKPWLGIQVGLLLEMLTLDDLPVGNALPLNGSLAAAAAILFSGGPREIVPAAAFPAGMILAGVFRRMDAAIRRRRSAWTQDARDALNLGRNIPFRRMAWSGALWHWTAFVGFLYLAVVFLGAPIGLAWANLPEAARRGFEIAFQAAPWLGAATLIRAFRWRL